MNRGRDLLSHRPFGDIEIGHGTHVLDAAQRVPLGVGMHRGHGTLVAGVHGLQHVKSFFAANLAHHDAVGTHTQAVDYQLPLAYGALALDVRRTRFQPHDVFLVHLQFRRVFDSDDAVGIGNVAGEDIQQCGLASAGSAGDQKIQPPLDHGRQQFQHRLGQGLVLNHVTSGDRVAAEAANGQAGAVDGQRGNNGVHAGSVGQAGIHHRRRFVHPPSDARDDAVDDLHQMGVVLEAQAGGLELAGAFHINLVVAVDQDIGDGRVFEQRFQRTQAEDFIENFAGQALPFGEAKRDSLTVHRVAYQQQNFFASRGAGGASQFFQVQTVENLAVKVGFDLLVLGSFEGLQIRHSS